MAARVLVTGAAGFLGRHVARRLRDEGFEIVAHARSRQGLPADGAETAACDLRDRRAMENLALSGPLDAIVHCAGLSSNWGPRADFVANNVEATRNVLALARRLGAARVVHVSSSSVCFAFRDQFNVREDAPLPEPVNHYAWSKAEAERVARAASDLAVTILRPRGIYGRGDVALLPRLLRAAARGPLPLFRDGASVIDLTHVEDVAAAIVATLRHPRETRGKTFNVSGGEALRVRDIIERSAARAGVPVRWRAASWPVARAAIRGVELFHAAFRSGVEPVVTVYGAGLLAFSQTLDLGAIRRETGWAPAISFDEGLRRTFDGDGP